jgi:hypothetical protein
MTTKTAPAKAQPAVEPKPATDPVAKIIERALHNPTAIQLQFQTWMVEQAEAHSLTFRTDKEREAFRVAVVIGSRSYPTFQAVKNGRTEPKSDADTLASLLSAESAPETDAKPKPRKAAPARTATAKAAPAASETLGLPAGSLSYFIDLAKDAGNWNGTPWFDGNVAAGKSASGYVNRLVKAGLIESHDDDGKAFCVFTAKGIEGAAKLGIDLSAWAPASARAEHVGLPKAKGDEPAKSAAAKRASRSRKVA